MCMRLAKSGRMHIVFVELAKIYVFPSVIITVVQFLSFPSNSLLPLPVEYIMIILENFDVENKWIAIWESTIAMRIGGGQSIVDGLRTDSFDTKQMNNYDFIINL